MDLLNPIIAILHTQKDQRWHPIIFQTLPTPIDMYLLNPIIAILHNQKDNLWHPIIFTERPLPGPPSSDKPVRHRSEGHHTKGFKERSAAVAHINDELVPKITGARVALEGDILWDGEGIPVSTIYFAELGGKLVPAL